MSGPVVDRIGFGDCIGCGDPLTEDDPRPFCEDCAECARSNPEWSEECAVNAGLLERPS